MPQSRKPAVGDIVHYHPGDLEHGGVPYHAAIVTRCWPDGLIDLHVFLADDGVTRRNRSGQLGAVYKSGWAWPPKRSAP